MLLITTFYLLRMSHTRNSSPLPFHPDVSHPESLSAAIPSGCLTPGIPLSRHSIRTRNSFPPPFHPDPEFLFAAIPFGPGIPLRRHSLRMFHIQNPSPPPFHSDPEPLSAAIPSGCLTPEILLRWHSTRMPRIRNPIRRRSIFSGCLTSEILSTSVPSSSDISHPEFYPADVPPFSSSLEHFL